MNHRPDRPIHAAVLSPVPDTVRLAWDGPFGRRETHVVSCLTERAAYLLAELLNRIDIGELAAGRFRNDTPQQIAESFAQALRELVAHVDQAQRTTGNALTPDDLKGLLP